jgi:uncharacterized protein (DUF302 family)
MADTGLITCSSRHDAATTIARLQAALASRKITVFAVFDHAVNAAGAGLALPPTTVVVFGNPAGGTLLMQANQVAGIDLPLKLLVWQDSSGAGQITYNDPRWIAARHALPIAGPVDAMVSLLAALAKEAAGD